MALKLRVAVATHAVDAPGVFVSYYDDEWDRERIMAEYRGREDKLLATKKDLAVAEFRAANPDMELTAEDESNIRDGIALTEVETALALMGSPTVRYNSGRTRFSLDAADRDFNGEPVTVRSYLKGTPTMFILRRMTYGTYREAHVGKDDSRERRLSMCVYGLKEIRSPGDGFQWQGDRVTKEVLQLLHDTNHTLIDEIGQAVERFNRPLDDEDELPRLGPGPRVS